MQIEKDPSKMHQLNQSVFILLGRLVFFNGAMEIIYYFILLFKTENENISIFAYLFIIIGVLNYIILGIVFINWYYHYYIITENDVSINMGFLARRTKTFDLSIIKSIKVRQGVLGRIFNYGTLELEVPEFKKSPILYYITEPYAYARILETKKIKNGDEGKKDEDIVTAV